MLSRFVLLGLFAFTGCSAAFAQNSVGTFPSKEPVQKDQQSSSNSLFSANDLDTLHYTNPRGVTSVRFNYNDTMAESEWASYDNQGLLGYGSVGYGNSYDLNATYGITDLLSVGLTLSEAYSSDAGTGAISGSNFSSYGVANPTLELNYRFWGGLHSNLMATVYGEFTPAMGQFSGTNSGANSYTVGAHVFAVQSNAEYEGTAALNYVNSSVNGDDQLSAETAGMLAAVARYHFNSYVFLAGGITDYLPTSRNEQNPNISWSYKQDSNLQYNVSVGGYLYRRSLVGQIGYTYSNIGGRYLYSGFEFVNQTNIQQSSQVAFASLMTDFR